jgi:hypothetical protein
LKLLLLLVAPDCRERHLQADALCQPAVPERGAAAVVVHASVGTAHISVVQAFCQIVRIVALFIERILLEVSTLLNDSKRAVKK